MASNMQLSATTQDAIEGLGLETTATVPNDLLCAVCLGPAFGGLTTQCEHLFHKQCIEAALAKENHCPTCRQDAGELKPMGRILVGLIGGYRVLCPQGCAEEVDWTRLRAHVTDDCPLTPMSCPHAGCRHEALPRALAAQHASTCDEAMLTCTCSAEVKRKDMPLHRGTRCPDELVSCKHCGLQDIKRAVLKRHCRKDCKGTATIPMVKALLEKRTRSAAASQQQLRSKNRRLEEQLETAKAQLLSQTNAQLRLERQLETQQQQLDRFEQRLQTTQAQVRLQSHAIAPLSRLEVLEQTTQSQLQSQADITARQLKLEQQLETNKSQLPPQATAQLRKLEEQLTAPTQLQSQVTDQLRRLEELEKREISFRLFLPTKLGHLHMKPRPNGPLGFMRKFEEGWVIKMFAFNKAGVRESIAVFVGLADDDANTNTSKPMHSLRYVSCPCTVEIGTAKKYSRVMGHRAPLLSDECLKTSARFLWDKAIENEQVVHVKIWQESQPRIVDL